MRASFFTLTAQTNLHVGSGDANYGIIDKLVQRDTLSELPVIHASSLKGAILQHVDRQPGITDEYIDEVFGRQIEKRWKSKRSVDGGQTGEFIFLQANLLSMPIRSNNRAYFRASGSQVLTDLLHHLIDVQLTTSDSPLATALALVAAESVEKCIVLEQKYADKHHLEDLKEESFGLTAATGPGLEALKELLGDAAVVLPDAKLRHLSDNHHLPVIARNFLENGQSTNLWYEQVLPRQTRFGCTILQPETPRLATDFNSRLTDLGLVQIGANATVGYGYCQFKPIKIA